MKYVLDTHAAAWLSDEATRLSPSARRLIINLHRGELGISDVTLSELARLICHPKKVLFMQSGRLEWLTAFASGFTIIPVSPAIALRAAEYDSPHSDPADRHILATADVLKLPLITIDKKLTEIANSAGVKVIW